MRDVETFSTWVRVGIVPARRPTMRVMETLTGSLLSIATTVLAVGAVFAF
ncbi:hypothetical protein [Sphingomonas sp.]